MPEKTNENSGDAKLVTRQLKEERKNHPLWQYLFRINKTLHSEQSEEPIEAKKIERNEKQKGDKIKEKEKQK